MAEKPDSVRFVFEQDSVISGGITAPEELNLLDSLQYSGVSRRSPGALMLTPVTPPDWQQRFGVSGASFIPGVAGITSWNGGALYATGGGAVYNGLMATESGRLNFVQNIGQLNITAYGRAEKIGFFRGLSTQWGFGGAMTYSFSPTVSLTLFGNYYMRAQGIANPGIREIVPVTSFGGYLDWRFAGRWGLKAGALGQQNVYTNKYELRPMVMPYFRLAPGADIGVDVGGILYEALRSQRNSGPYNPTIGPMKLGPPPVGPRN